MSAVTYHVTVYKDGHSSEPGTFVLSGQALEFACSLQPPYVALVWRERNGERRFSYGVIDGAIVSDEALIRYYQQRIAEVERQYGV